MSFSNPVEPIEPSTDKYWITTLNQSSVKSPFEIKFTLVNKPERLDEIKAWLSEHFKSGCKFKQIESFYFAEIFFRCESDATMFVLQWGESFT